MHEAQADWHAEQRGQLAEYEPYPECDCGRLDCYDCGPTAMDNWTDEEIDVYLARYGKGMHD